MDDIRARHAGRHWCMASSQAIDAGLYESDFPDGSHLCDTLTVLAALDAANADAPDEPDLSDHPGEFHTFSLACDRCGKRGYLHLSVLGPDERFSIEPLPADVTREERA